MTSPYLQVAWVDGFFIVVDDEGPLVKTTSLDKLTELVLAESLEPSGARELVFPGHKAQKARSVEAAKSNATRLREAMRERMQTAPGSEPGYSDGTNFRTEGQD